MNLRNSVSGGEIRTRTNSLNSYRGGVYEEKRSGTTNGEGYAAMVRNGTLKFHESPGDGVRK